MLPTLPVFTYPVTSATPLADLIVNAWKDPGKLLERDNRGNPTDAAWKEATKKINAALSSALTHAVIISEDEHDDDYIMQNDDEVVFVLPDRRRAGIPDPFPNPGPEFDKLLATAKLLMACTPNGI
jgi:hypothetical protein